MEGFRRTGFLGAVAGVAVVALTGGTALAAGAAATGAVAYAAAKRDKEVKQARMNESLGELQKCKEIINKCCEEIDHMKEVIGDSKSIAVTPEVYTVLS